MTENEVDCVQLSGKKLSKKHSTVDHEVIAVSIDVKLDEEETVAAIETNEVVSLAENQEAGNLDLKAMDEKKKCYECNKCKRSFFSFNWFQKHFEVCATVYQCEVCPKQLKNIKCLKEHRMKLHGTAHTCESCGTGFSTALKLQAHVKKAHQEHIELFCPKCKVKSKNKKALWKHLKYKCRGEKSVSSDNHEEPLNPTLVNEKKNNNCVTNIGQKKKPIANDKTRSKFPCKDCPKQFYSTQGLRKHIATHRQVIESSTASVPIAFIVDEEGNTEMEHRELGDGELSEVVIEYVEV